MAYSLPVRNVRRFLSTTATTVSSTTTPASVPTADHASDLNPFNAPGMKYISDRSASPGSSRYPTEFQERNVVDRQRVADIESLIESHKKDPKITQEPYLSGLIQLYGLSGMFDHALKTYNQMEELSTPRSVLSFNALLTACYISKQFRQLPDLFSEFPKKFDFAPDVISYGILIKSFCKLGLPTRAADIIKEMEEKAIEITAATYTPILDALYKKEDIKGADELWMEMKSKGYLPDVAAYNVRLMYSHEGQVGITKALIEEMKDAGLKPDTVSYNYLMISYCVNGMTKEAMEVYEGLEGNGCEANLKTYRALTFHLCSNRDFDEAYRVMKKGVQNHSLPKFETLRDLLEGLVKCSKKEEALELVQMVKKEFPFNFLNYWKEAEDKLGLAHEASVKFSPNVGAVKSVQAEEAVKNASNEVDSLKSVHDEEAYKSVPNEAETFKSAPNVEEALKSVQDEEAFNSVPNVEETLKSVQNEEAFKSAQDLEAFKSVPNVEETLRSVLNEEAFKSAQDLEAFKTVPNEAEAIKSVQDVEAFESVQDQEAFKSVPNEAETITCVQAEEVVKSVPNKSAIE